MCRSDTRTNVPHCTAQRFHESESRTTPSFSLSNNTRQIYERRPFDMDAAFSSAHHQKLKCGGGSASSLCKDRLQLAVVAIVAGIAITQSCVVVASAPIGAVHLTQVSLKALGSREIRQRQINAKESGREGWGGRRGWKNEHTFMSCRKTILPAAVTE